MLLYVVQKWTLTEATTKKLETFEFCMHRWLLKISWTEHVTNKKVSRRQRREPEITVFWTYNERYCKVKLRENEKQVEAEYLG